MRAILSRLTPTDTFSLPALHARISFRSLWHSLRHPVGAMGDNTSPFPTPVDILESRIRHLWVSLFSTPALLLWNHYHCFDLLWSKSKAMHLQSRIIVINNFDVLFWTTLLCCAYIICIIYIYSIVVSCDATMLYMYNLVASHDAIMLYIHCVHRKWLPKTAFNSNHKPAYNEAKLYTRKVRSIHLVLINCCRNPSSHVRNGQYNESN